MSTWRPMNHKPLWKRWLPLWMHSWIQWTFLIGIGTGLALCAVSLFYFLLATGYNLAAVAERPSTNTFYDRDGQQILFPGVHTHAALDRAEIPQFLIDCLLVREDVRFMEHQGVDLRGLARATVRNLQDRNFTQGGSTISMQLARNSYPGMRGKTLHRKFLEIAITLRIEALYSKDEILAHYLNRIYFGSGAYGISQAARVYFGLPASELNEGECAMIVGIIRGPHIFSPFRNYESAIEQRDQTLARMLENGTIQHSQYQAILGQPIRLLDESVREAESSFALRAVDRELDRIIERELGGSTGSLHVFTTLDSNWQARVEREIHQAIATLEAESEWKHPTYRNHQPNSPPAYLQFATITTETRTGEIMSWIGGRDISHSAVDRTRSRRDLGGTFEPWVAAAAAERGKLVFPLRPIQTGRQIGHEEVIRIAKRFGITGRFTEGEDLFRGWVGSNVSEISTALATLGNHGKKSRQFLIREIRDESGKTLYRKTPEATKVVDPEATAEAFRVFHHQSGTRTFHGISGNDADAWLLRLGPNGATVIWIGFDQPQPITNAKRLRNLLEDLTTRLSG